MIKHQSMLAELEICNSAVWPALDESVICVIKATSSLQVLQNSVSLILLVTM